MYVSWPHILAKISCAYHNSRLLVTTCDLFLSVTQQSSFKEYVVFRSQTVYQLAELVYGVVEPHFSTIK
jgi:hypothetical protein